LFCAEDKNGCHLEGVLFRCRSQDGLEKREFICFAKGGKWLIHISTPLPGVSKSQGVEGPQLFFFWFLVVLRPGGLGYH
jgi:hypothetical protein